MTSEYPDFVFVVYDGDTSDQTYDITVSCEAGTLVGKPVKYIRHDLNTRAVPDVPELVRLAWSMGGLYQCETGFYTDYGKAAEIIAAKDKEIDRAEKHRNDMADKIVDQRTEIAALRTKLAQYEVQKPFGYVVERHSLSVDFQYEPLTSGGIESGIKATAVYVSPAPSADVKAKIEEYFAAKTAYDDAVKPNGAFGQPKILRHHNPIVQRYVAATAALKEVAH